LTKSGPMINTIYTHALYIRTSNIEENNTNKDNNNTINTVYIIHMSIDCSSISSIRSIAEPIEFTQISIRITIDID